MKITSDEALTAEKQEVETKKVTNQQTSRPPKMQEQPWLVSPSQLSDGVAVEFLRKLQRKDGRLPTCTIPLRWHDRGNEKILEIDMAQFSGNGSGLSFCFTQQALSDEYLAGVPFKLPLERLERVPNEVFGLEKFQEIRTSYLPGEMYYINKGPAKQWSRQHHLNAKFLIRTDYYDDYQKRFTVPNVLVRLHLTEEQKNAGLADEGSELYRLLTRDDVVQQRWTVSPAAVTSGMDIYMVLCLKESRKRKLIREDLLPRW